MFKRYSIRWHSQGGPDHGEPRSIDVFLHRKHRRNGTFFYRAVVLGEVPRIDDAVDSLCKYRNNTERLERKKYAKSDFAFGRDKWPGQGVLCKLWNQMAELPFVDMQEISVGNPFDSDAEPDHEDIIEPDDVFNTGKENNDQ